MSGAPQVSELWGKLLPDFVQELSNAIPLADGRLPPMATAIPVAIGDLKGLVS